MATVATRPNVASRRREHTFYTGIAVVIASVVFVGFSRTYFLKHLFGAPALPPLVHVHALLFTTWIALFITQTTLVSARRTDVHMRLGIAGFLLAVCMMVVGPLTAIASVKRGHVPVGLPPVVFLSIPLFDILLFSILISAGFFLRRKREHHKRLMLVATLAILPAAFARFPPSALGPYQPTAAFIFTDLVLLAAIAYDTFNHRRLHPAFAWAGLLLIVSYPLRLAIAGTSGWTTFAQWLIR
jgi:hypothetical protein